MPRSRRRSRRSKSRRRGKCYGRMSGRRGGAGCYKRMSRSRSKRRTHCDGRSSRRRGKSYGCGSRMSRRRRSRRRAAFGMAAVKAAMANPELTRDVISAGARMGAEIIEKHPEVLDTVRRSMRRGKLGTKLEDYRAMFDRRSRRRSRRRGAYY